MRSPHRTAGRPPFRPILRLRRCGSGAAALTTATLGRTPCIGPTALARLCRVFGTVTCTRAPGLIDQELNSSTLPQLWLGGDGLEAGSHYFTTWAGPRGEPNFTSFRLRFGHARWPHGRRPSLMPPIDGAVRCCDADHRRLSRHRLHPEYRHLLCRLFTIGLMPQCCALEFGAEKWLL